MPYKVLLVGLACFHTNEDDEDDVMALLPDGTDVSGAKHFASIVVRATDVIATDWAYKVRNDAKIFRINQPMALEMSHDDQSVSTDEPRVPSLCDVDPSFTIDRNTAKTIATLQIYGVLKPYYMPDAGAIYSELITPFDHNVQITSQISSGAGPTIILQPRSEIAIVNVSPGLRSADEEEIEHFKIYGQLTDEIVDLTKGPQNISPDITKSNSIHPVFDFVTYRKVTIFCSNTGCC
jgi:hypothetical protein